MPNAPLRQSSALRVDAALRARGILDRVRELPSSTRTAAEAAQAVGCSTGQIVKSLVFRAHDSGQAILVLAAGSHRVDEDWMRRYTHQRLIRADPEFVRTVTGFAIGGVPPIGHPSTLPTYIDLDLLEEGELWAAAGHPHAICRLTARELVSLTQGRLVPVVPPVGGAPPPSRWIAFDCYGTLVDWRTGLLGQLKHLAPELSPTDRDQWFDAYLSEERIIEAGPYLPYREVMGHAVVRAARSVGVELSPAQALEVAESIPNWPAFPDTGAALATLRANGFRIAVLSNIDSGLLDRTLSNLALPADCVVTAQEVGSYKPAWNHWIRFLKRTATLPDQVWHVSGSYEHDIEPARSLGFRTAYVERQGGAPARGDLGLSVRGLADLVDRLLADPIPS